jgi:hypothetical protein
LRAAFRWDRGQIENLALLFLAHEDHPDSTTDAFLTRLRKTVEAVKEQDAKKRPEIAILRKHLAAEAVDRAALPLAAVVDLLPKALDRSRVEAFDIVRDRLNKNRPEKEELSDGEIVAELWQRYGEDADVLNNLALEYLAQNSHAVAAEVAKMDFDKPVEELPAKAGIGRTKSFAALSCAHGATDEEVLAALADLGMDTGTPDLRPVVYLAQVDHRRFTAIAKRNWSAHKPFLRSMIRHDDAAIATVLAEIDDQSPLDGLAASVKSIVGIKPAAGEITEEGIDYTKLAEKPELIRKALEDKDWTRSPEQAARLLELNPYEARALVAAEVRNSLLTTTRMLWDTYDPQYKVWLPFAAIGVLATIALGIFGQMAKRWADMNA